MDDPRPAIVRSIARRTDAERRAEHAVKARPVPLSRKLAAEDGLRLVLLECLAQVSANAGAMRSGRQPESLHQLRVGLRRIGVALSAFGDELRTPLLRELRDRSKAIASRLGPARDLDVFLADLLVAPARNAAAPDAFAEIRSRAEAARERAWDEAAACVVSADFGRFLDDVAGAAERVTLPGAKPVRIGKAAARVLDAQLERARKRGRKARTAGEGDLHRLRIALKKLRYASEFFGTLYDKGPVRRYRRQLKELQDSLGRLNDIAHLKGTLARLIADAPPSRRGQDELIFAAGEIEGWHRACGAALTRRALRRWKKFRRADPFWR